MNTPARWILGLVFALWPLVADAAAAAQAAEVRLMHGDDPRWSAPGWDDSAWPVISANAFPARTGPYWARIRVARGWSEPNGLSLRGYSFSWPDDPKIDALFIGAVFSFELYWDGRLLERGGVVGASRAEEVAGPLDHLVRIPDELLGPGEHVLALRMSSHHYNFPATQFRAGITFTNHTERLVDETRAPIVPLLCLGGSLLMALISEVLYRFVDRRRTLRLCGALGLLLAIFYGLIAFRWLYNAPYYVLCPRLMAITVVLTLVCVLLPWLLLEQFAVPRRRLWFAVLLPLLGIAWIAAPNLFIEMKALWICRASFVVSLAAMIWATWRRRPGAAWVLVGVAVGLFAVQTTRRAFLDPTFFLIFEGLVLFVFATIGVQVRADRKRALAAELTASRLETELLKKNIQPHFLLNTLATIIEVIEQEPKAAVALIEALAGEFRILAGVSGEKLIPLAQELELCRAHLRVMSLRHGVRCALETHGVDERVLVPPALFHTLIENGLTHLAPRGGAQRFELRERHGSGRSCYTLLAHGERRGSGARTAAGEGTKDGTGTRYIKARLEESFTGRWTLRSEPCEVGWCTEIEVRDPADAEPGKAPMAEGGPRADPATDPAPSLAK